MTESVDLLGRYARLGLVGPFVNTNPGLLSDRRGWLCDRSGRREVDLFETLGQQEYETIRVVALAGPGLGNPEELGELTDGVCSKLAELAPPGLRVMQVRMWIPPRTDLIDGQEPPAPEFFSPRADANLVVIPEDRPTSDSLAAPIVEPCSPVFVEHAMVEIATLLGLWAGMAESPVDELEGGVLGFGEPKLHLVRSFVRVGMVDSPRFAVSFTHQGRLPAPRGMVEAPYPQAAASELADRIEDWLFRPFEFRESTPPTRGEGSGARAVFVRLGRGITGFLRRLPEWLLDLSRDPVARMVRRQMPDSALVGAVERAVDAHPGPEAVRGDDMAEESARRFHVSGGARIPQQIWKDLGETVFSAVDGGQMPEGVLPSSHSGEQHALITDLTVLFPRPDRPPNGCGDHSTLQDRIRDDTETLFGRICAALSKIVDANRLALETAIAMFDRQFAGLGLYRLPDMAWVGVVFAGLLLVTAVGVTLGTGLAEVLGIAALTGVQRTFVWIVLSGLLLVATVAVAVSAYSELGTDGESHPEEHGEPTNDSDIATAARVRANSGRGSGELRQALIKIAAVAGGVAAASYIAYTVGWIVRPYDALGFGAALGLAALQGGLIWIFRSTGVAGKVMRRFVLISMVYAAVGLVGLLARQHGWYGDISPDERMLMLGPATAAVLVLAGVVLVVAGWWYGRKEHLLRSQLARLACLEQDIGESVHKQKEAEEAREQFIGASAAWADLLWHPFGAGDDRGDENLEPRSFAVRKAALECYRMPVGWLETAREKWVQRMAVPGWVFRQYETAVRDFQRNYAGGLTGEYSEMTRPDQDPRVVSHVPDSERARISLRWRFLSTLRSGAHDPVLRERIDNIQDPGGAEWVISEIDTLAPVDNHGSGCRDFLVSILSERDAEVNPSHFCQKALADNADRAWKSRVWLPPIEHDPPGENVPVGRVEIRLLRNGHHAVFAVRHDLAGPYELTALFAAPTPAADPRTVSANPDTGPLL